MSEQASYLPEQQLGQQLGQLVDERLKLDGSRSASSERRVSGYSVAFDDKSNITLANYSLGSPTATSSRRSMRSRRSLPEEFQSTSTLHPKRSSATPPRSFASPPRSSPGTAPGSQMFGSITVRGREHAPKVSLEVATPQSPSTSGSISPAGTVFYFNLNISGRIVKY